MKTLFLLPILLLSLISTPCLSETMDELVKRDGLYYEKLSKTLFTGKVTGKEQGRIKNGKKEGEWVEYYPKGLVGGGYTRARSLRKGSYKDGEREGEWYYYYDDDGKLSAKGSYKNGEEEEGEWFRYNSDGIEIFRKTPLSR